MRFRDCEPALVFRSPPVETSIHRSFNNIHLYRAETALLACLSEGRTSPKSPRGFTMSSQAQIDANRRNSKKSTGPVTPEGKAICSQNALKSGIYAFSHVIRGEDPDEFDALKAAFLEQYQPADPTQLALVDTLIATEWTQRRLRRIEAELWERQLESLDQNLTRAEYTDPNFHHSAPLGQCYQNALEAFSRVQCRIESTNRMFLRTLKAL